jgi:triacylglycerol lipase
MTTTSWSRRCRRALGLAIAVTLLSAVPAAARPASRAKPAAPDRAAVAGSLPVPYGYAGFLAAGANFLAHPGGAPTGANDWSCAPSAAHPNPVVLVHGASANMTVNWETLSPLLKNNGYCVFALTYGIPAGTPFPFDQIGGRNPMEESAAELGGFVDQVLAATGASEVDIVGHSEGSLMPNYYVKFLGGASKVRKYVGLTPLWDGSNVAFVANLLAFARAIGLGDLVDQIGDAVFPAALQFVRGSEFLAKMNEGDGPAVAGVDYTMVLTKYDEAVVPYTSGLMDAPNAKNVVLQKICPLDFSGHGMVAFSRNTAQVVLNALDPAHAKPFVCYFVAPAP